MRGDVIDWHFVLGTIVNETIDPSSLSCRRPTHTQQRTDRFQSVCGNFVEFVISLFGRVTCPEVQVRFIPNLKIPVGYFSQPVSLDQVLSKLINELIPFLPIFRRGYDRVIPEWMNGFLCSQPFRHEAEFYKRANPISEQSVVDQIEPSKIQN